MGNYPVKQLENVFGHMSEFEKRFYQLVHKEGDVNQQPMDMETLLKASSDVDYQNAMWDLYLAFRHRYGLCVSIVSLGRSESDVLKLFVQLNKKLSNIAMHCIPQFYAAKISLLIDSNRSWIERICCHQMQPDHTVASYHKAARSCEICEFQIVG